MSNRIPPQLANSIGGPKRRVRDTEAHHVIETLRNLRMKAGLTQAQLGKRFGYPTAAYIMYRERPTGIFSRKLHELDEWAEALGYDIEYNLVPIKQATGSQSYQ